MLYTVMALALVAVVAFVYSLCSQPDPEPDENAETPDRRGIVFDWTVIDEDFYLEVKNGSRENFEFDVFLLEGKNLCLIGLNAEFEQVYLTEFGVPLEALLDGVFRPLIDIHPGKFHRVKYDVSRHERSIPEAAKYLKFRWTSNAPGTNLPVPVESTIYELR